jgi:hypothetical protein
MKIELHKAYKTRGGHKAVIVDKDNGDTYQPWLGYNVDIGETEWYYGDGSQGDDLSIDFDIVAEWQEPKRLRTYYRAAVYKSKFENTYLSSNCYYPSKAQMLAAHGDDMVVEIEEKHLPDLEGDE